MVLCLQTWIVTKIFNFVLIPLLSLIFLYTFLLLYFLSPSCFLFSLAHWLVSFTLYIFRLFLTRYCMLQTWSRVGSRWEMMHFLKESIHVKSLPSFTPKASSLTASTWDAAFPCSWFPSSSAFLLVPACLSLQFPEGAKIALEYWINAKYNPEPFKVCHVIITGILKDKWVSYHWTSEESSVLPKQGSR